MALLKCDDKQPEFKYTPGAKISRNNWLPFLVYLKQRLMYFICEALRVFSLKYF